VPAGRRAHARDAQGNKGAVAVRCRVHDSILCVVNSHLAAHQKNVIGRNADYANIVKRLAFPGMQCRAGRPQAACADVKNSLDGGFSRLDDFE
jgi:hypothetical protein